MATSNNYLFSELDGFLVMENQKKQLRDALTKAPESLSKLTDDEVIAQYVSRYDITVPKLLEEKMMTSEHEVDIDVSRDPRRMIFQNGPGGFYIKGTEITVHIPFTGEGDMFRVRPNQWSSVMPTGRVSQGELLISYRYPNDNPPANLRISLEANLREIKQYLGSLEFMMEMLRGQLTSIATQAWQTRRAQFSLRTNVLAGLGLPAKVSEITPPTDTASVSKSKRSSHNVSSVATRESKLTWDAFISHASEDKENFVKPLAIALNGAGIRVWYDEYTLNWGDSLRGKIDEGLSRSTFGIVVLSPSFFAKHWTKQELNGLAAREVNGMKVILPIWHGIGQEGVTQFSPTLADRRALKSTDGIPHVVKELLSLLKKG